MDAETFLARLPALYEGWGTPFARPRSPASAELLRRVNGMTSPGVLQLLNAAVGCLGPGECYCEVGTFQGATLLGALLGHPSARAFAVDDFSEFDPHGHNRHSLRQNLEASGLTRQVSLYDGSFEPFFLDKVPGSARLGVYLYDGAHDYRSTLMGLLLAVPSLADQAVLVVDDSNVPAVAQAAWDFAACQPHARVALELPTPGNGHPSFWNGVMVLAWDRSRQRGPGWEEFRRARRQDVVETLYAVRGLHLREEGGRVAVVGPR